MLKITNKKYKGQTTLLIVIMVMAVSLGIGVAVTQRQTSNLRKTTYTSQTDQGFSCANSGVEKALLCIKEQEQLTSGNPKSCTETAAILGNCNYTYTVTDLLPTSGQITLAKLPKDNVQQFTLAGDTNEVTVEFSNFSDYSEAVALELTYAYYDGSEYKMAKKLIGCNISTVTEIEGFDQLSLSGSSCSSGAWTIPAASENILRIRTYLADATLKLEANGDFNNVSQGYKINSTGTAGNVTRNIEVYRMHPQLPALFDYVLYSEEGTITK